MRIKEGPDIHIMHMTVKMDRSENAAVYDNNTWVSASFMVNINDR